MEAILTIVAILQALAIGYLLKPSAKPRVVETDEERQARERINRQYDALFSYSDKDALRRTE